MMKGREYKRRTQLKREQTQSRVRRSLRVKLRWIFLLFLFVPSAIAVINLDIKVRKQFEGKRWALPARVFARPLELYPGKNISPQALTGELEALGYNSSSNPDEAGEFRRNGRDFYLVTRAFDFWDGNEPSRTVRVRFEEDKVSQLADLAGRRAVPLLRLDPRLIGKIYPSHNEDRILVRMEDVPKLLIQALVSVEDRKFYEHHGISPRSLARATFENIKAGRTVQGGSTITQQLVKNYFLSSERTFTRKFKEAIMSILLEFHYEKQDILEVYLNEVYFGQSGSHGIHGIGMASWFYFNRPIGQLKVQDFALLAGMVRSAIYYNPRKYPERALQRRNLVLKMMYEEGYLDYESLQAANQTPLNIADEHFKRDSPYPHFLDLVRKQLRRDYREEDLRSEGLQVFTTLDPLLQRKAETSMVSSINDLERRKRLRKLQGALIVTDTDNGEVLALVGGRQPRYSGFNRAFALRPVGSLVKPAIYLTALEDNRRFSLSSKLQDDDFEWTDKHTGETWTPKNYDGKKHGTVPMLRALSQSYNLATVHLGFEVGLEKIKTTLHRLGIERDFPAYPSMLLGGISMSPLEMTQVYQTIAGNGFRVPLRAIRAVLDRDSKPLNRYDLKIEQHFDPAPVYLLRYALQEVLRTGTGYKTARELFGAEPRLAGKTGTSNDLRDSWFAGFGGNLLAVAWLGRDDNRSIRLTGSDGAMRVWGNFMRTADYQPLDTAAPVRIKWRWVNSHTGSSSQRGNYRAIKMPFISGVGNSLATFPEYEERRSAWVRQ